jgi:hypothetical protein
LIRKDTGYFNNLVNTGFFSGNITFDVHIRQSLYTVDKTKVKCDCLKEFASNIQGTVDNAVNNFLGPKQS